MVSDYYDTVCVIRRHWIDSPPTLHRYKTDANGYRQFSEDYEHALLVCGVSPKHDIAIRRDLGERIGTLCKTCWGLRTSPADSANASGADLAERQKA